MDEPFDYGRKESKIMAGVAILMMLVHHFFGFRSKLAVDVDWSSMLKIWDVEVELLLASFGKLCVFIFSFTSGYALWVKRDEYKVSHLWKRALRFMMIYWVVMAFYLVCGAIWHYPMPKGATLLLNMIGIDTGPGDLGYVNVPYAWYVTYYLMFLALAIPLLHLFRAYKSNGEDDDLKRDILIFVAAYLVIRGGQILSEGTWFSSVLSPLPVALIGLIFAKHDFFSDMDSAFKNGFGKYTPWACLTVVVIMMPLRSAFIMLNIGVASIFDLIIVPLFIYCALIVIDAINWKEMSRGLLELGRISLNIWFLHGIFFTVFPIQYILYEPKYTMLILFWGLIMLVPLAWVLNKFEGLILRLLKLR